MCRFIALFVLFLISTILNASEAVPPFMGDWEGRFSTTDKKVWWFKNPYVHARVIGRGGDEYEIRFLPRVFRRAQPYLTVRAKEVNGVIAFESEGWKGTVTKDRISGAIVEKKKDRSITTTFDLSKAKYSSPTLGMKPPKDAVILFNGKNLNGWKLAGKEDPSTWKVVDGVMEIFPKKHNKGKGGDAETRRHFKSIKLHVEFKLPYEPENSAQGRCNSGVFLPCGFEVQVLDSFGAQGMWDECGALYKVSPPKVNGSLPPGSWQTYDIEYYVPEFDDSGKVVKEGVVTVRHNGQLIHNKYPIATPTAFVQLGQELEPSQPPSPIRLQDHGHRIQFRNMWLVELD